MLYEARWQRAITFSVVFHVFVFVAAGFLATRLLVEPSVKERLLELSLVHAPATATANNRQAPVTAQTRVAVSAPAVSPATPSPARAVADVAPESRPAAGGVVAMGEATPAGAAVPAAGGAATEVPVVAGGQPRTENAAAGIIEAFIRRLEERKEYPYIARKRGQTGTVVVRVRLTPEGALGEAALVASSGFDRLDEAALRLVHEACPFVHGLGRSVVMNVPITYDLKER